MPDVVVIGSGLAGTATALYLARGGVDVWVLDARPEPPRPFPGLVDVGVVEHPHRTVAALGEERARHLFAWTAHSKELLDAEGLFDRCGLAWASVDAREPAEVAESERVLTSVGLRAEAIDADEAARRTGATGFGPTLWLPDDGRLVEGALATLTDRAQAAGATFRRGRPARLIDGVRDVQVAVGDDVVRPEVVVIATGAGSGAVSDVLRGRITPVRDQGLRLPGRLPGAGRAGQGYITWNACADGTVEVGGARWVTPHLEVGEADESRIVGPIQERLQGFAKTFLGLDAPVLERWARVWALTPDGLPIVGPLPGDPRRIVCAGFGASPPGLAIAAARAVADGLLEGGGEVPWFLSPRRMVRWRAG